MSKKILIDLLKLRDLQASKAEGLDHALLQQGGFKTIRELATFKFTCRKCEDAPCINVCPVDALEKNKEGVIDRALNLCIRCKSCITICPFGTMMNDLFEVKTSDLSYYDLKDEEEMQAYADSFPDDVVRLVEMEEDIKQHIYKLSDCVLVRDFAWVIDEQ